MHIHPDATEREELLCSLFNMKKKPNKKERTSIIGGFLPLCSHILIHLFNLYFYILLSM